MRLVHYLGNWVWLHATRMKVVELGWGLWPGVVISWVNVWISKMVKRHVWFGSVWMGFGLVGVVGRWQLISAHALLVFAPDISIPHHLGLSCKTGMHLLISLNFEFRIL